MNIELVDLITHHIQTFIHEYPTLLLEESKSGNLNINTVTVQKTEELINTIKSIISIPNKICTEYKQKFEEITEDYNKLRDMFMQYYYPGNDETSDTTMRKFQLFATQIIKLKDRLNKKTFTLQNLEDEIRSTKIALNEQVQNKIDSMREEITQLTEELDRLHKENDELHKNSSQDYSQILRFLLKLKKLTKENEVDQMADKIRDYIETTKNFNLIHNSIENEANQIELANKVLNDEIEKDEVVVEALRMKESEQQKNQYSSERKGITKKDLDELHVKYNEVLMENVKLKKYEMDYHQIENELEQLKAKSYEEPMEQYDDKNDFLYLICDAQKEELQNRNKELIEQREILLDQHNEKIDNMKKIYNDLEDAYKTLKSNEKLEREGMRLEYENKISKIESSLVEKHKIALIEYENFKKSNNEHLEQLQDKYNKLYDDHKKILDENVKYKRRYDDLLMLNEVTAENNKIAANNLNVLLATSRSDNEKIKWELQNKHEEAEKFIEENTNLRTTISKLKKIIESIELQRDEADQKVLVKQDLLKEINAQYEEKSRDLEKKTEELKKSKLLLDECDTIRNRIKSIIERRYDVNKGEPKVKGLEKGRGKVIDSMFIKKLFQLVNQKSKTKQVMPSDASSPDIDIDFD